MGTLYQRDNYSLESLITESQKYRMPINTIRSNWMELSGRSRPLPFASLGIITDDEKYQS
jgi:hypothetical protein